MFQKPHRFLEKKNFSQDSSSKNYEKNVMEFDSHIWTASSWGKS